MKKERTEPSALATWLTFIVIVGVVALIIAAYAFPSHKSTAATATAAAVTTVDPLIPTTAAPTPAERAKTLLLALGIAVHEPPGGPDDVQTIVCQVLAVGLTDQELATALVANYAPDAQHTIATTIGQYRGNC